ncbi:Alpha-(1,3)-fucosyltransferase C, partial [Armadillidium vulgare]
YGDVYKKKDFQVEDFSKFENFSYSLGYVMKTKNKLVSWIVSHCNASSKRDEYVKELQKFIPVDIYGKCGPLKCDIKEILDSNFRLRNEGGSGGCLTLNTFTTHTYHIIPVVRGSADYAAIAPPHSYINVEDFETQKDLANYLIYLDKNDTAYMEYFNWKKNYFVMNGFTSLHYMTTFCTLCQKLHSDKTEKIYYNLTEWFLGEAQCNKNLSRLTIPSST